MPLDILGEIFKHCLPEPLRWTPISPKHAPLSLCNVCSAWRILAISTPGLWKVLNMYFGFYVPSAEHVADLIHLWIGRAGALPLVIKFGWGRRQLLSEEEYESSVDRSLRIYSALSKYASRWESLQITLPRGAFASFPRSDDMPLLRYLFIRAISDRDSQVSFLSAPRLTTLVTDCLDCKPSEIPTIPWHQLTVLCISDANGPGISIALDLIKCCLRQFLTPLIMTG